MADKFQKLSGFGKLLFNANKNKLFDKNINNVNSYFTYSPEPAQPLPRDPKFTTAEEAIKCIKSGILLFILTLMFRAYC